MYRLSIRDVMFTESDGRLLLFLFGCSVEAAEIVMSRLFVTTKDAATAWKSSSDPDLIRRVLSKIDTPRQDLQAASIASIEPLVVAGAKREGSKPMRLARSVSA